MAAPSLPIALGGDRSEAVRGHFVQRLKTAPQDMKHAGPAALAALSELLAAIRARGGATEPHPGVFYRKSRAWLHFHEDAEELFADLRLGAAWVRFRITDPAERASLVATIDRALLR